MGVGNAPGAHGWGLGKRAESVSKCIRPGTWGQVRAHSSSQKYVSYSLGKKTEHLSEGAVGGCWCQCLCPVDYLGTLAFRENFRVYKSLVPHTAGERVWQHDWDLFPYKLSTGLTQAGRQGGNSDQQSQGPREQSVKQPSKELGGRGWLPTWQGNRD